MSENYPDSGCVSGPEMTPERTRNAHWEVVTSQDALPHRSVVIPGAGKWSFPSAENNLRSGSLSAHFPAMGNGHFPVTSKELLKGTFISNSCDIYIYYTKAYYIIHRWDSSAFPSRSTTLQLIHATKRDAGQRFSGGVALFSLFCCGWGAGAIR